MLGAGEADVLALALRAMADGVAIVERSGRIRFVNRALAEAWGAPVSAIVGRLAADFVRLPGSATPLDSRAPGEASSAKRASNRRAACGTSPSAG